MADGALSDGFDHIPSRGRVWTRPALVVLMRGGREETVLTGCKTADDYVGLGPEAGYSTCYKVDYCYEPGCSVLVSS